MKRVFLVLGLLYIFSLLGIVLSSWGLSKPGYTVDASFIASWCVACVAPFVFGYFAGYERSKP